MQEVIDPYREEDGEAYSRGSPPWAEAVTLRADPQAMLAIESRELLISDGISTVEARGPMPGRPAGFRSPWRGDHDGVGSRAKMRS